MVLLQPDSILACGFAMQLQLASCIADPECLENLACLQLCNGRKDEAGCQVPPLICSHLMKFLPRATLTANDMSIYSCRQPKRP